MSTSTGSELLAVGQVDQVTDGTAVAGEQVGQPDDRGPGAGLTGAVP
jgi:hypothetical protein